MMPDARIPVQDAPDPSGLASVLAAAAKGDESAWRTLVAWYARRLYALARSRGASRELAEELTQSVLVTVVEKLRAGEYLEQGRFEPWLFRIAMNRLRDEVRRAKRRAPAAELAPDHPDTHPASHTSARSDAHAPDQAELSALHAALEELPDADRQIVSLRHHAGMSFKDIAELLHEPVGTLLARHHRALRKLKSILESRPATRPA